MPFLSLKLFNYFHKISERELLTVQVKKAFTKQLIELPFDAQMQESQVIFINFKKEVIFNSNSKSINLIKLFIDN